jgi:4-amino-4-deoxy-L-arabinose transferase-like glycosyltransferase
MGPSAAGRTAFAVLLVLLLAAVAWISALDFLPPLEKDSLIHHLAVPKLWLKDGGMVDRPWLVYAYYPMNLDLLYLIPLALGVDWGAKFIHFGFGLLTAGLLYCHLTPRLGRNWGLLAAVLFLTTPAVMRLAASAYVDLGLTFFITAGVLALLRWHETHLTRYFVWSALALGLGLGVKYNGLIGLPVLTLWAMALASRQNRSAGRVFLTGSVYALLALAVFSPWAIKNYLATGNPLYPLFSGFFGQAASDQSGQSFGVFTLRNHYFGESLWENLLVPLRIFFSGRDFDARFFDGVLNPFLLLLPPLALIRPRAPELRPLAGFVVYWILVVLFQSLFVIRYMVPVLPVLVILSVYGLKEIKDFVDRRVLSGLKAGIWVLIPILFLALNANWAHGFWQNREPWPYLTGRESREAYLSRHLDHYPAMAYLNSHLPETARVLLLFVGSRGYYCDRDYLYSAHFSGDILRPIMDGATSSEDIRRGLKALGVTHVLTREGMLVDYLRENWPPEKTALFGRQVVDDWENLFSANGYTLFRIK